MGFDVRSLPYAGLPKARFDAGLASALPATPEGAGDVYYATDTATVYVGNSAGGSWAAVGATIALLRALLVALASGWGKGYLISDTGSAITTLAPGANGQVVSYDSAQSSGLAAATLTLALLDNIGDVDAPTPTAGGAFLRGNGYYFSQGDKTSNDGTVSVRDQTTGDGWTMRAFKIAGLLDVDEGTPTAGDLLVHDGTNYKKLAVGTNGQVLVVDTSLAQKVKYATSAATGLTVTEPDGSPLVTGVTTVRFSNGTVTNDGGGQVTVTNSSGASFSGARAYKNSGQTITGGAGAALITWDSEDYDTDSYHSTGSNTERFIAPSNGYYNISFSMTGGISASATANVITVYLYFRDVSAASTTLLLSQTRRVFDGGTIDAFAFSTTCAMDTSDYIYAEAEYTRSGSFDLNIDGSRVSTLSITRIG